MGKDQTPTSETRSSRGGFWFGCQSRLPDWTKERRDFGCRSDCHPSQEPPPASVTFDKRPALAHHFGYRSPTQFRR